MQLHNALMSAGLARPSHRMGEHQDKYQGIKLQCGNVFDITGKRGYLQDTAIANIYALNEDGELQLLLKHQHIYQPRRNGAWYIRRFDSSGRKLAGIKLKQYETNRRVLLWAIDN